MGLVWIGIMELGWVEVVAVPGGVVSYGFCRFVPPLLAIFPGVIPKRTITIR